MVKQLETQKAAKQQELDSLRQQLAEAEKKKSEEDSKGSPQAKSGQLFNFSA